MNWSAIREAAQLAQAAYTDDAIAASSVFASLGHAALGQWKDGSHLAYVLRSNTDGQHTLAISGTRFGRAMGDLLSDADIQPTSVGSGAEVSGGAFAGCAPLYHWANGLVPDGASINITGHSLGGERALLCGFFLPVVRVGAIHAFEAPKCANTQAWAHLSQYIAKSTCVVNGRDLWFGWPFVSGWSHPPVDHIHLTGGVGQFEILHAGNWPTAASADDHSIDLVVNRIELIEKTAAMLVTATV